jgi:hypothetical protein
MLSLALVLGVIVSAKGEMPTLGVSAPKTISSIKELNTALDRGPNRKVGFLSTANYNSVKIILNDKVEPEFYGSTSALYAAVENEVVIAGLMSGQPDSTRFLAFSTDLISPRAFQMKRGTDSRDLMQAIDAAVVRTHDSGELQKAEKNNPPFEAVEVHTCHTDNMSMVPFPDAATATGLLKDVLDTRMLRILAFDSDKGKPDWHQDGNYQVDPPTGFWPDYMRYFMAHFKEAYGNDIELERVWYSSGGSTAALLEGTIHMTEPYYIYESLWEARPKKWSHEFSCIVSGYEQQFFAKGSAELKGETCEERLEECNKDSDSGALASSTTVQDQQQETKTVASGSRLAVSLLTAVVTALPTLAWS